MSDVNGLRLIPKVTPQSRCFGNHTSPPIGGDMDSVCCSTQYGRGFLFLGVSDSQITESGIDMKLGESRESDDVPVAILINTALSEQVGLGRLNQSRLPQKWSTNLAGGAEGLKRWIPGQLLCQSGAD